MLVDWYVLCRTCRFTDTHIRNNGLRHTHVGIPELGAWILPFAHTHVTKSQACLDQNRVTLVSPQQATASSASVREPCLEIEKCRGPLRMCGLGAENLCLIQILHSVSCSFPPSLSSPYPGNMRPSPMSSSKGAFATAGVSS